MFSSLITFTQCKLPMASIKPSVSNSRRCTGHRFFPLILWRKGRMCFLDFLFKRQSRDTDEVSYWFPLWHRPALVCLPTSTFLPISPSASVYTLFFSRIYYNLAVPRPRNSVVIWSYFILVGSFLGQEKSLITSAQAIFIRTDKSGMHNVLKHCAFYNSRSCKIISSPFDNFVITVISWNKFCKVPVGIESLNHFWLHFEL